MITKQGFIFWDNDRLSDKSFSRHRINKACVNNKLCDEMELLTKMVIKKCREESIVHSGFAQLSDKISTSLFDLNDSIRSKQWYTARSLSRVIFENIAYLYYCLMDDDNKCWERMKSYVLSSYRTFVDKQHEFKEDVVNSGELMLLDIHLLDSEEADTLNKRRKLYQRQLMKLQGLDVDPLTIKNSNPLFYEDQKPGERVKLFNLDNCQFYMDSNEIGGFRSFVEKRLGWTVQYIQLYVSNNNAIHSNYDAQYGLIPMKLGIRHGYYDTIASRVLEDVLYRCIVKFDNINDKDFSKEIKSFESDFNRNLILLQPFECSSESHKGGLINNANNN